MVEQQIWIGWSAQPLDFCKAVGKTLLGSIFATMVGGGAFIAQVTLYSKAPCPVSIKLTRGVNLVDR